MNAKVNHPRKVDRRYLNHVLFVGLEKETLWVIRECQAAVRSHVQRSIDWREISISMGWRVKDHTFISLGPSLNAVPK